MDVPKSPSVGFVEALGIVKASLGLHTETRRCTLVAHDPTVTFPVSVEWIHAHIVRSMEVGWGACV